MPAIIPANPAQSLYGTKPNVVALAADTATRLKYGAFTHDYPIKALTPTGAATISILRRAPTVIPRVGNVDQVGMRNGLPLYIRIVADGTLTSWDSTDLAALANLHDVTIAGLNATNRLRTVVLANKVLVPRVGNDDTFDTNAPECMVEESGGDYTINIKKGYESAAAVPYGKGTIFDIFMDPDGDNITTYTMTASILKEIRGGDFACASAAAALFADD